MHPLLDRNTAVSSTWPLIELSGGWKGEGKSRGGGGVGSSSSKGCHEAEPPCLLMEPKRIITIPCHTHPSSSIDTRTTFPSTSYLKRSLFPQLTR